MGGGIARMLVTLLAFAAVCCHQGVVVVRSLTDPKDMSVLKSFRRNMVNGEQLLVGWEGEDACEKPWPHIECIGSRVSQIQVANLGLSGPLPSNLNQLSALVNVGFQRNNFSGALPTFRGLTNLVYAYLDNNLFDTIPADFFEDLPSLQVLALDNNQFNASSNGWTLPKDILASIQLQNLSLTNVSLSGPIPDFLGSMPSLQVLHLAYNNLSGHLPVSFNRSSLRIFQVNNQVGPYLTGPIDVVGTMESLSQLWLQVNQFIGTIPEGLGNAVSLTDLKLNDNQLVGPIPSSLKDLPLSVFTVENNHLNGPLPPINVINSDNNHFCLPDPGINCAPVVTALLKFLSSINYPLTLVDSWQGNDPCLSWSGITCQNGVVSVINLANSELSGNISPFLSNVSTLSIIKLNGNKLTGQIPESLVSLKSLKILDVTDNQLSGPIPVFSKSVSVRTGGNYFSGAAPSPSPTASPSVVKAAPPVHSPIGAIPSPHPPTPSSLPSPKSGSSSQISNLNSTATPSVNSNSTSLNSSSSASKESSFREAAVIGLAGGTFILLLVVLLGVFFLVRKRRKKFPLNPSPNQVVIHPHEGFSDPELMKLVLEGRNAGSGSNASSVQSIEAGNMTISIQVLRAVTSNFSERNILGRGGFGVVYRGELHDGTKIAVKRMEAAAMSNKGLSEFQAEITVLTKVRHCHLVGLLGYCIDGNERILVYEYMPYGPLSHHLFDWAKYNLKPLEWKKRLTIALDVARGVEYLHNLAHRSFIHRDLKPSNILLADDYRAKVSDFGLVKLAPDGMHSIETRLAGTFGYLAPEYAATGRVTTKSDVFSFGVVLMELITGRRALDESRPEESMHLVSWFRRINLSRETLRDAVDPVLEMTEDTLQSIFTVAELARHCTAREPSQRPNMGHAVTILAPLVEKWKPTDPDYDEYGGIDLEMTLPQALKRWQAYEDISVSGHGLDDTSGSLPTRPAGFAESFTSSDGR